MFVCLADSEMFARELKTMTLPTRPDGGIDYHKAALGWLQGVAKVSFVDDVGDLARIMQEIAAHARERCAKWHESMELTYLRLRDEAASIESREDYNRLAVEHRESAAAIRKIED